jgi:hypothetical protein
MRNVYSAIGTERGEPAMLFTEARPEIEYVVSFTAYDGKPDQIIVTLENGVTIEEYMAIHHTGATNIRTQQQEVTAWGTPITQRNQRTGKFDVFLYGNWDFKLVEDLPNIDAVGKWARFQDGELGTVKQHCVIGRYREVYLPHRHPVTVK